MLNFLKNHKTDLSILLLAITARVVLFFINLKAGEDNFLETVRGSDWYYEVSQNLFLGNGFSIDGISPSPVQVPIYPLFLASSLFLFGSYKIVVAVQIFLGSIIPVLARYLSLKLIPNSKVAIFVALVVALEPNFVLLSSIFFTETLFIFLFLLFILSFISYLEKGETKMLCISAVILGLSTLVKTTTQFFPIFLIPIAWWFLRKKLPTRKLVSQGFIFMAIFLIILSPWLYRNYKQFGAPGLTIMPTLNLYATLLPSVLSVANNTSFTEARDAFIRQSKLNLKDLTFANSGEFNKEAINEIKKHPKAIIEVATINVLTFFTHDGMLTVLENAGIRPETYPSKSAITLLISSPIQFMKVVGGYLNSPFILVLIMRLVWLTVFILFLLGVFLLWRNRGITPAILFGLVLVAYFAVTTASNGLTVNARFRMPIEPIIIAIAAYPFIVKRNNQEKFASF